MVMTRRDFILIAETVKSLDLLPGQKAHVAMKFAERCSETSPNFKQGVFLAACGVTTRTGTDTVDQGA